MSEWIDVKVTRPKMEEGSKIIGYFEGDVFDCVYEDGYWCNVYGNDFTHWMPFNDPVGKS